MSEEPRYPDPSTTIPERVLMIQAHPDDAEFGVGGTVAKWAAAGSEIYYCSITSGDKGSSDLSISGEELAALREQEQLEAAKVLGVKDVIFLRYLDATLEPNLELRRDLTRVIRQVRPTALIAMDPTVRYSGDGYINHPDHIAAGEATMAAVFPSCRDPRTFPELLQDEGLEAIEVPSVYISMSPEPDCFIDISDHIDTKIEALSKHVTQVGEDIEGIQFVREWARENTKLIKDKPEGFGEFSESFRYMHIG